MKVVDFMKIKLKNIRLSFLIIILLFGIGMSYAFFGATVTKNFQTESVMRAKRLGLVFEDTKLLNDSKVIPGDTYKKTFKVISESDEVLKYNIRMDDIFNTFNNDFVYRVTRDGEEVVAETPMPKTNKNEYILADISINPGETHNYEVEIKYVFLEDVEQNIDGNSAFQGTFTADVEKDVSKIIYVHEQTNELSINSIELAENKEQKIDFTVRNNSAVFKQKYNILLEDLINDYAKDELTYSLIKNGEEVVSNKSIPVAGELNYIYVEQMIDVGETDYYTLVVHLNDGVIAMNSDVQLLSERYNKYRKVTFLANDNKVFNATVVIDQDDVDVTPPLAGVEILEKTSSSIKIRSSCIDEESDINKYVYYLDGELIETVIDNSKERNYVFNNLKNKEYDIRVSCVNNFMVETRKNIKTAPNELVIPTIEVDNSNFAPQRDVNINYFGEGDYLFKVVGNVQSNIDVSECVESSESSYACGGSTKNLENNKWYKTSRNIVLTYSSDGTIIAKVADGINYKETNTEIVSKIDNVKPTISIINNGNSKYSNSHSIQLLIEDDNSGIQESKYLWSKNEEENISNINNAFKNNDTLSIDSGSGIYYLYVYVKDKAGNYEIVKSNKIYIDNDNPTCSINGNTSEYTNEKTL